MATPPTNSYAHPSRHQHATSKHFAEGSPAEEKTESAAFEKREDAGKKG